VSPRKESPPYSRGPRSQALAQVIDDPKGLLAATAVSPRASVLVGLWLANGLFQPLRVIMCSDRPLLWRRYADHTSPILFEANFGSAVEHQETIHLAE
jgi:hypothetical protein